MVSGLGEGRNLSQGTARVGQGPQGARRLRPGGRLRGRVLLGREKGGSCVGKTKWGKGTKVVAAVDGAGLPLAVGIASASPHEVKVLEATLDDSLLDELPERLIGDKAYDSDKLDERLWDERGVKLNRPTPSGSQTACHPGEGRELPGLPSPRLCSHPPAPILRSALGACRRIGQRYGSA